MILLTFKNGIPSSWSSYRNSKDLVDSVNKRCGVNLNLTYQSLISIRKTGKLRVSSGIWILWDAIDEMHERQLEDSMDERYLHDDKYISKNKQYER